MNVGEDVARSLYLELSALGLELWVGGRSGEEVPSTTVSRSRDCQALRCPVRRKSASASGATKKGSCGCSSITATPTSGGPRGRQPPVAERDTACVRNPL